MSPRQLHAVPDQDVHHGPLAVDPTHDGGAALTLAPETAVHLATRIVKAATPEQMARITAATCAAIPGGTGVTLLAALLLEHVRLDLDGRDLDALVDQLDDAASPVPPPADPVESAAADAADARHDLLRGK